MPCRVYDKSDWIVLHQIIRTHLDLYIVLVVDRVELCSRTGEKFPLVQHPMSYGPVFHLGNTGCAGIGVDRDQFHLTAGGASQLRFGGVHNIGSQRAERLTTRVDECQHDLVATQRRERDRLAELVSEREVGRETPGHGKTANGVVRWVGRWSGKRTVRGREKSDAPGSPDHDNERRSDNQGNQAQFLQTIQVPHNCFLSPDMRASVFPLYASFFS